MSTDDTRNADHRHNTRKFKVRAYQHTNPMGWVSRSNVVGAAKSTIAVCGKNEYVDVQLEDQDVWMECISAACVRRRAYPQRETGRTFGANLKARKVLSECPDHTCWLYTYTKVLLADRYTYGWCGCLMNIYVSGY